MASVRSNKIIHFINVVLILALGYLTLYFLLLYKVKMISSKVIPVIGGIPAYEDADFKNWLSSFDKLIYLMVGVIVLIVIVRYIIEALAVTHDGTIFRTLLFWAIGTLVNFALLVYFFKVKAPVLEGDNLTIFVYTLSTFVILYLQMILFVPSSIKYLMFPRNIIFKRK